MKFLLFILFILFINQLFCQIDFYIETDETYYTYGQDIFITFNLHNTSPDTVIVTFPNSFPFNYYIDDEIFSHYSCPVIFNIPISPDSTLSTCCVHTDNVNIGNHLLIGEFLGYQYSWFTNPILIIVEQISIVNHELQQIGCKLSNYPNPFNPTTTISFNLTAESTDDTELSIYNIKGQKIRQFTILNNQSSIVWDGKDSNNKQVSSGIYFYKLKAGDFQQIKKMMLIK